MREAAVVPLSETSYRQFILTFILNLMLYHALKSTLHVCHTRPLVFDLENKR